MKAGNVTGGLDDEEDNGTSEFGEAEEHRRAEEIIEGWRFDIHNLDTYPDPNTHWPWEIHGDDRQSNHEVKGLLASCRLGVARIHLPVWSTIVHGNYGANGTIRLVAWDGRGYETTPKPVDEMGSPTRRSQKGVNSYRNLEALYGIPRCSVERSFEDYVNVVLPYRNGAYDRINCVLLEYMAYDLGAQPQLVNKCDWLEELAWSLGDLNEVLLRRCPSTRTGRDSVRSLAYRLVKDGRVSRALAKSFRIPNCQTAKKLDDEYTALETVVGYAPLNRIMGLLGATLS